MIRKIAAALVAFAALVALAACDPNAPSSSSGSNPRPNPGADAGGRQPGPNDQANVPGPVRADPSAHDPSPGSAAFDVYWRSETKANPSIIWAVNGAEQPAANITPASMEGDRAWHGNWEIDVPVKTGDVLTLKARGPSLISVNCVIIWKGQFHGNNDGRTSCSSTFTIP